MTTFRPTSDESLLPPSHSKPPQRSGAPRSHARITRYIIGIYILVSALIICGSAMLIQQDRVRQDHAQAIQLSSLTRTLQEYISRALSETNLAMSALRNDAYQTHSLPAATQTRALREIASRLVAEHAQLAVLSIQPAGAREAIIVRQPGTPQSLMPPKPSSLDHAPSLPFQVLSPIRDPGGKWFLPIHLGFRASQTDAPGSVLALLNLDYIEAFYQDIRLTPDDKIHLLDATGKHLMSFPASHDAIGKAVAPASRLVGLELIRSGITRTTLSIDGDAHIGAFSKLREFPLIVGTSRSQAVADSEFFEMRRRLVLASIILILMLGLLSWLIHYDIGRREVARQALRELNTSLEERVRQRTAELELSNRELMAFSYSVSHDLRAPLRAINGFAHALKDDHLDQLDTQGQDYLDRIYRASLRMGDLIDELLSLANVSRAPLKHQTIDLAEISREIIEELRIASPERAVEFRSPEKLLAEGDEALLRNALTNLLNNAWKFTRSRRPAEISLSAEPEATQVKYVLEDNGVGFDMAHAKRLFQPFQQLHVNQGYGGTGIGLASVRRIIERHGGQIWAEAVPDAGARFIFILPRHANVLRRRERTAS